jgi:uncharacterized protein YbjT (DUF2867 family)
MDSHIPTAVEYGLMKDSVLVAGASGDTGGEVLGYLDGTGATVTALTRSAESSEELLSAGADSVVVGNLFDPRDAESAVEGIDVVLSAVGSTPRDVLTEDEFVDGVGNINLARAAEQEGVRHVVMESAIGVGDEATGLFGASLDAFLNPIQEAKADAEREIRSSDVDHTILRPGALTSVRFSPSPQVADAGSKLWGGISRKTVAELMAASPYTPEAKDCTLEAVENALLCGKDTGIDWQYPTTRRGTEIPIES